MYDVSIRWPKASFTAKGVRGILVRGSMAPCRLRRRKFWKFDYQMVYSEVYLNKYVVNIAPFSTPPFRKLPFCMFSLFNFSSIFFRVGVSWPHLPLSADAHVYSISVTRHLVSQYVNSHISTRHRASVSLLLELLFVREAVLSCPFCRQTILICLLILYAFLMHSFCFFF